MAYDKSKGLVAIATSYSGGNYGYTKLDGYIKAEGLTIIPNQMQDLDSYVNSTGKLRRNVLSHTRSKIDANTPYMSEAKFNKLLSNITKAYSLSDGKCSKKERKVRVRYYNQYTQDYSYGYFYIPDIEFQFGGTWGGEVHYLPTRIGFIEY